ncbi:glycosyltransferase [Hyphomonas sp.]|uniref:glycosyltransferase n=1 Tax=Hyphomonas sp. TaxID=87 RepID=UPI003919BD71
MFRTGNGLGRAARACYEALKAEGFHPLAVDLSTMFNQADLEPCLPLGTLNQKESGTLIIFANPPEMERALAGLGLRRWHRWRIIGAWAWELTSPPRHWARQTRYVSEVWAPSQFVADSFSGEFDCPIRVVPHFIPVTGRPSDRTDGEEPLLVLTLADARSSLERKNPAAALRMFRAAFPASRSASQKAEFVFKCRNLHLFPAYARELQDAAEGDERISILDQTLPEPDQSALLDGADIILSPHRSEGFGVHLAEAMARGKSVIATGWSGNLEFMSAEASILLPYRLGPVKDPTGVYAPQDPVVWAEADFDAGVEALRSLADDPARRARISESAQAAIRRRLGSRVYRNAIFSDEAPHAAEIVAA